MLTWWRLTFNLAIVAALGASISTAAEPKPRYVTTTVRGRVVWMSEALARRFQVKTVPEAAQRVLALETADGQLLPLVEDIRGRSFRRDKRLRNIDVELLVRRYEGSPAVQVIRVFAFRKNGAIKKEGKYELDYWCEICAIAMFELKECACCQGPIELRWRHVEGKLNVPGKSGR